jgi:hypothetical protein
LTTISVRRDLIKLDHQFSSIQHSLIRPEVKLDRQFGCSTFSHHGGIIVTFYPEIRRISICETSVDYIFSLHLCRTSFCCHWHHIIFLQLASHHFTAIDITSTFSRSFFHRSSFPRTSFPDHKILEHSFDDESFSGVVSVT